MSAEQSIEEVLLKSPGKSMVADMPMDAIEDMQQEPHDPKELRSHIAQLCKQPDEGSALNGNHNGHLSFGHLESPLVLVVTAKQKFPNEEFGDYRCVQLSSV
ncbi:hypothetical protein Aduo_008550 [Ancylostoma duodenale]